MDNDKIRLNRAIALTGYCSRRKADELIESGKVFVNGVKQSNLGAKIYITDEIQIDGKPIKINENKIYLMLNKPIQVVCTSHDPQGRKTIFDILPEAYGNMRLFSIGRLDFFSEGLLLLTNDGKLAQRLAHPSHKQSKVYEVEIRNAVDPAIVREFEKGMRLDDGTALMPVKISVHTMANGNILMTMTLWQGINRQIRKMCEQRGLTILKLKRIAQAGLRLGNLQTGCARPLTSAEVRHLHNITE